MNKHHKPDIGNNPFPNKREKIHPITYGDSYIRLMGNIDTTDLSPRGRDLAMYILGQLEQGEDYVYIDREEYMKYAGITLQTARVAIAELIKTCRLSKTCRQGWYWINTDYINTSI